MKKHLLSFVFLVLTSCATAPQQAAVDWQAESCPTCEGRAMFVYSALAVCPQVRLENETLYNTQVSRAKITMGEQFKTITQKRIAYFKEDPTRCEGVAALTRREPAYFGGMIGAKDN
jgi:uncharacterized protein with PIN domain